MDGDYGWWPSWHLHRIINPSLLGGSSHLVSGLVHPSYKWDFCRVHPLKSLGWTNPNPLTSRGMSHQVWWPLRSLVPAGEIRHPRLQRRRPRQRTRDHRPGGGGGRGREAGAPGRAEECWDFRRKWHWHASKSWENHGKIMGKYWKMGCKWRFWWENPM